MREAIRPQTPLNKNDRESFISETEMCFGRRSVSSLQKTKQNTTATCRRSRCAKTQTAAGYVTDVETLNHSPPASSFPVVQRRRSGWGWGGIVGRQIINVGTSRLSAHFIIQREDARRGRTAARRDAVSLLVSRLTASVNQPGGFKY